MRVLVTGATGFIGGALAARLAGRGDRVRALVRPTSSVEPLRRLGVELAAGDLADAASLRAAVAGCEAVVHVAGAVKVMREGDFLRVNGEGTRAVAGACAAAFPPPRLVYVSSLAAAGPSAQGRARREEDPPAPVSRYGESKLAGEREVRAVAGRVEASIVRPPAVYGPGDRELVPALARLARFGLALELGPSGRRLSLLHVDDLSEGILAVLDRGRRLSAEGPEGTYFLEDGAVHAWGDLAREACAALGTSPRTLRLPELTALPIALGASLFAAARRRPSILSLDKVREMRQMAWTCSSERARRELAWAPRRGLAEGMREAVGWLRAQGRP